MRNTLLVVLLAALLFAAYAKVKAVRTTAATASARTEVAPVTAPTPRMSPGIAYDSSGYRRDLTVAPSAPDSLTTTRSRPTPIEPMTRVSAGGLSVALGDSVLPGEFQKGGWGNGLPVGGPGPYFYAQVDTGKYWNRVIVSFNRTATVQCIWLERFASMRRVTDSVTALLQRPYGQRLDDGRIEELVWWGADSRLSVSGFPPKRNGAAVGAMIYLRALPPGAPVDTTRGPVC